MSNPQHHCLLFINPLKIQNFETFTVNECLCLMSMDETAGESKESNWLNITFGHFECCVWEMEWNSTFAFCEVIGPAQSCVSCRDGGGLS